MRVDLLATDKAALKIELLRNRLSVADARSVADMQTLIIALGGGVGVAAVIKAIGDSLKSYFETRAADDKVILKFDNVSIEANGSNVAAVLAKLNERLEPRKAS